MASFQHVSAYQPQQLTGLVIIRAHEIYLALEDDETREIREIFLPFKNVSKVFERTVDIGQGRSYKELQWEQPIDDRHTPGLASLLRYLDQRGYGFTGPQGPTGPNNGNNGASGPYVRFDGPQGLTPEQMRRARHNIGIYCEPESPPTLTPAPMSVYASAATSEQQLQGYVVLECNCTGPTGGTGSTGPTGSTGSTGQQGPSGPTGNNPDDPDPEPPPPVPPPVPPPWPWPWPWPWPPGTGGTGGTGPGTTNNFYFYRNSPIVQHSETHLYQRLVGNVDNSRRVTYNVSHQTRFDTALRPRTTVRQLSAVDASEHHLRQQLVQNTFVDRRAIAQVFPTEHSLQPDRLHRLEAQLEALQARLDALAPQV